MSTTLNYTEVILKFHRSALTQMEELKKKALLDFSCSGVEEFIIDEAEVDRILGERSYSGGDIPIEVLEEVEAAHYEAEEISFKFYFEGQDKQREDQAKAFSTYAKEVLESKLLKVDIITSAQQDWNQVWREHYQAIPISPLLKVIPSWEKVEGENLKGDELFIYPGQGFGTGGHETTHLCLEFLSDLKETGKLKTPFSCLDFGCGSGILGIGAYKLGSAKEDIIFYDIDEEALKNTEQNCALNEMNLDLVQVLHSSQRKLLEQKINHKKFDLVFANILMNVLELECDFLISSLKQGSDSGSYLILSGLLKHQGEAIKLKFLESSLLEFVSEKGKNDWLALCFKRR
jgi:ribosomal protein L11 methyltransferase